MWSVVIVGLVFKYSIYECSVRSGGDQASVNKSRWSVMIVQGEASRWPCSSLYEPQTQNIPSGHRNLHQRPGHRIPMNYYLHGYILKVAIKLDKLTAPGIRNQSQQHLAAPLSILHQSNVIITIINVLYIWHGFAHTFRRLQLEEGKDKRF